MCEETSIRNKAYGIKERIEKASDMNIEQIKIKYKTVIIIRKDCNDCFYLWRNL